MRIGGYREQHERDDGAGDQLLMPNGAGDSTRMTSTARVGTARPRLATAEASAPPRPRWPRTSATGSATAAARTTARPEIHTCSPEAGRDARGPGPVGRVGEPARRRADHGAAHAALPRAQGVTRRSQQEQQPVQDQGEHDDHDGGGEHLGVERRPLPVEDAGCPARRSRTGRPPSPGRPWTRWRSGPPRGWRAGPAAARRSTAGGARVRPIPVAASRVSSGTPRRPTTMFRSRIPRV